jgi:hypothetical protein
MSAISPLHAVPEPAPTAKVAHTARNSGFIPDATQAVHRDHLVELASALITAQGGVDVLLTERRRVLAAARKDGVPVGALIVWTGLGRQRIGQLLADRTR